MAIDTGARNCLVGREWGRAGVQGVGREERDRRKGAASMRRSERVARVRSCSADGSRVNNPGRGWAERVTIPLSSLQS